MTDVARALVSRRWWWVTLIVAAMMIGLARLGIWQLDRLAERRQANAQLLAALESAPIDLNATIAEYTTVAPGDAGSDLANRDVTMTGAYDFANQRILKLQNWEGRAGVHLITPFILDGSNVAVLVDRGWIPDAEYEAGNLFTAAEGRQTVTGYVALTETISRRTAEAAVPASPGDELFRVDIAAIGEELPHRLAPFYIKEEPPAGGSAELPIRIAKEVDLSEGPHLSYAMQWFIFSLGLGIGYVVFVRRSLLRGDQTPEPVEPAAK